MAEDWLQADPEALRQGGVDIDRISLIAKGIQEDLLGAIRATAGCEGTGKIREAFKASYYPTRDSGLEFLDGLNKALAGNAEDTATMGGILHDANAAASSAAKPVDEAGSTGHAGKAH